MGQRSKRKRRPRPDAPPAWTPTDLSRLSAAGEPTAFRLTGERVEFDLAAQAAGADGKPALKKFSMTAYTGGAMDVGWGYPVVCDLEGLTVPAQANPILKDHDTGQIVGHSTKVEVSAQRVAVAGVVSGVGEAAGEVQALAANGFPWQASIGASVQSREFVDRGQSVKVNGRNFAGPVYVARRSTLGEVSFVAIGADQNTSAAIAAHQQQGDEAVNFNDWIKARGHDPAKLTDAERNLLRATFDAEQRLAAANPPASPPPPAAPPPTPAPATDAGAAFQAELARQLAASREAAGAEAARQAEVSRLTAADPLLETEVTENGQARRVNLRAHALVQGWSAQQTELAVLRAARPRAPAAGPTVYVTNKPELNEAVLEAAMLHALRHSYRLEDESFYTQPTPDGKGLMARVPDYLKRDTLGQIRARYTDQVQQGAHTLFKGRITLHQFLDNLFAAAGETRRPDWKGETGIKAAMRTWQGLENRIQAEGSSAVSISNVLANVMNKFALQGYLFTEQAWRSIAAIHSVNDFKPVKSVNLLGDVMFKAIGSTGELENASVSDQAFANQAQPYGRILTLPWTHIVNDDLSILGTVPQKLGQGAGLALNDVIWALWKNMAAGTVNGDDGVAFWRTTNSVTAAAKKAGTAYLPNKLTGGGSVLATAGLQAVKALFDNQIDPNGNPLGYDGMKPVLLFGPTNWPVAMNLLQAAAIVYGGGTALPGGNVWQGYFEPVMSRYLENANYGNSTTAWWMLFNAIALAVLEVCFLNGVDTPAVLQADPDFQFDRLGISIRGTMPFGATQQNFRGGVYSVGA